MSKIKAELDKSDIANLQKAMKELHKRTKLEVQRGIAKATLETESVAAENAPVDTGRLRQSIRSQFNPHVLEGRVDVDPEAAAERGQLEGAANGFNTSSVVTVLDYAPIQERKHRFMQKGFRAGVRKLFKLLKL